MNNTTHQKLNLTSIPSITPGGSSSSQVLNNYFKGLARDLVFTHDTIASVVERVNTLNWVTAQQYSAIQSLFQSFESRLNSYSVSGTYLLDVASSQYLINTSVCDVRREYSQATLPVTKEVDLLVYTDVTNQLYIPETTSVETYYNGEWFLEPHGDSMLKGELPLVITWNGSKMSIADTFKIKVNFPVQYQGLAPSVIEFAMLPAFLTQITAITYQTSTNSTETNLDFSYVPGYNPTVYGNNYVNAAGPIRLFLPVNTAVVSVTISFKLSQPSNWGLNMFKLKHLEFASSGSLIFENTVGTFTRSTTLGKSTDDLSSLSTVIEGNRATVTLNSLDPFSSPVITGLIVK